MGKPIFIIGANFGPFQTEERINDYRKLFKMCNDVCFRDLSSFEMFKELQQVRYAPDIVFQMEVDEINSIKQKNKIGFSIIDLHHKKGLSGYNSEYIKSTVLQ